MAARTSARGLVEADLVGCKKRFFMPPEKLDARFRKKISQLVMLLAKEKETGKIDWHSRAHLSRDLSAVAIASNEKSKR
jgi:hypothetical protein